MAQTSAGGTLVSIGAFQMVQTIANIQFLKLPSAWTQTLKKS